MTLHDLTLSAIKIWNQPIELDEQKQPKITLAEKKKINEKQIKAISFGLKSTQELLENQNQDLSEFMVANIGMLVSMTCLSCE